MMEVCPVADLLRVPIWAVLLPESLSVSSLLPDFFVKIQAPPYVMLS